MDEPGIYEGSSKAMVAKLTETNSEGYFTIPIDQGVLNVLVYADEKTTPGFDYVPAMVKADPSNKINITLIDGASVFFNGDVQFVETENLPTSVALQAYDLNGNALNPSGFLLMFGRGTNIIQIPGLSAYEVIVPTDTPYRVISTSSVLIGS